MNGNQDDKPLIVIRQATLDDAEWLALLGGQLGYPMSPGQARQRLESILQREDITIYVAEALEGQVIGWIQVCVRSMLLVERHAEIEGLVVAEGVRGQGVGRLLTEQAEAWARRQGCVAIDVRSNVIREGAHRFYERLGYHRFKSQHAFHKPLV